MPNPFHLINPLMANPLLQKEGTRTALTDFAKEKLDNARLAVSDGIETFVNDFLPQAYPAGNAPPAEVNTFLGKMPSIHSLREQSESMSKEEREAGFQRAVQTTLENVVGLGITKGATKLTSEALKKLATEAEEITVEGGAKALKEMGKDVTLYPSTILKHATNELRRTPAQMAELTAAIQKEGVKPGAIQMWRMPNGTLKLVEGHHTSTIANALDPTKKLTVKVMDAPAGQTMF